MKLVHRLVLALAVVVLISSGPAGAETRFPGDERQAKLAARYRVMLTANPSEGMALDRLWKLWDEQHAASALIDSFATEAKRSGGMANWLIYGHLLKKAGRLDEAAQAYEAAAQSDPAGYLPLLARGELALTKQEPAKAAPWLEDAIAKLPSNDPRRTELRIKLGEAWVAVGQPDKAVESWEAVIADNPTKLPLRRQIAEAYSKHHLAERALVHYEYIAAHDAAPQQADAWREIGRIRETRGDFDAARDAFENALRLTARDNWLHGELLMAIIRLYERAGRGQELAARWQHDAAQSPRDLGGLLRLEELAETRGDAPGQREWLEKIVALAPRDRDSRLKLARLLTNLGERDQAIAAYDTLLADQPGRLELLLTRADLDVQADRLDEAAKRLEKRLAAAPGDETVSTPVLEFFVAHHLDKPAESLLRRARSQQPDAVEPGIALAKFCLARKRPGEARTILDHLADNLPTDTARMEAWQRVATAYRDADLPADALRVWRLVEQKSPGNIVPKLAIAELQLATGETESAAKELELAADLAPEGTERETTDRRLFDVLSAIRGKALPNNETAAIDSRQRLALRLGVPGEGPVPSATAAKDPVVQFVAKLAAVAKREPTPANLLRLARWQSWTQAPIEATDSLERIVSLYPDNIPARRRLVELSMESKQYEAIQRYLSDLLKLDPDHRFDYLRQLASLQMERGDLEATLAAYEELLQSQPDSADTLADLAVAQQRADHWFDALATWRRAYALPTLSPAQKSKILRPLVAANEHLADFKAAAETLLSAADAQVDAAGRRESLHDLSDFCRRHDLLDWLDETFERRRAAQPNDYPTLTALAVLRITQGRALDACDLLSRAYYGAPDPVAALKALTEAAESAGDDERALDAWRRLLGLPGQDTPSNLQRLAALAENALDEGAATGTWNALISRFPRDTDVLLQASEFFERTGEVERARSMLSTAVTLGGSDAARTFHLGELERQCGNPEAARICFEEVLAQTENLPRGYALELPDDLTTIGKVGVISGERFFTGSSDREPPVRSNHRLRLRVIRELAHLLPPRLESSNGTTLTTVDPHRDWLRRWQQAAELGAREDALTAFYESGDSVATMDLLEGWMSNKPAEDRLRSAYLQAGLRLREYRRLARWTWPEDNVERGIVRGPLLIEALGQFLLREGEPSEAITEELFPAHLHARDLLWRAAGSFADRQRYRQASKLGARICALSDNDKAGYGLETVRWMLLLGEVDNARELLGKIVAGKGMAYDGSGASASLEVLRVYYTLLPAEERRAFVEDQLRACRERGERLEELFSGALLYGLQGDEIRANAMLDAIVGQRLLGAESGDPVDVRRWASVLIFGNQLQAWHLEKMAIHLWRQALREVTAFDRSNSGLLGTLADIRSRLLVLEVRFSENPEQVRAAVAAYLRQTPLSGVTSSTASQLLSLGQISAARQLYEFLVRVEPNDGDHWRNYLSTCESIGDSDAAERSLQAMLNNPDTLPPGVSRVEIVRLLASWQKKDSDAAGAIRLLEREYRGGGGSSTILTTLAYVYENAGMWDDAARVWETGASADAGNARNYRLALARLEESRGHLPRAISILEQEQAATPAISSGEGPLRLVKLYLQSGRDDEARQIAERVLNSQDFQCLLGVAKVFARAKRPTAARDLLAIGVKRCREADQQFKMQQEWLKIWEHEPNKSSEDYLRGLRRLRQIARSSPTLRQSYVSSLCSLPRDPSTVAWIKEELKHSWQDGRGDTSMGQIYVKFLLETQSSADVKTLAKIVLKLSGSPEQPLTGVAEALLNGGAPGLARPIYEQLTRRYPQNEAHAINLAVALAKSGQGAEATWLLEVLDSASVVRGDLTVQIADAYQRMGLPERATELQRRAVADDPFAAKFPQVYALLAKEATQREDWPGARQLLSAISRQPVKNTDLPLFVDFLFASGEMRRPLIEMPGREFALSFGQRAELLALIYQKLKNSGQKAEARAFLSVHSDFLPGSTLLAKSALADAELDQLPACVSALELAREQSSVSLPSTTRTLAAFYLRWAELETNGENSGAQRLAHLTRANQLAPQDFEIARRLALLNWERGGDAAAVEVLQSFLQQDAVPSEREQARQLLAKH